MALLGNMALVLALGAALLTVLTGGAGGNFPSRRNVELSRFSLYMTWALLLLAGGALMYGFLTHDFSLKYVHGRSDTRMPVYYVMASFWGGQEGSLLFWALVTSTLGVGAAHLNRDRLPTVMPYYHAVMGGLLAALLAILVFVTNPFDTFYVMDTPTDGVGLNPLLQNPLMTIHPPCLLAGLASFGVPWAFCMAAMLAGETGSDWLKATRMWTLISWAFLTVGNILGGMWAYRELGWGGYWAWDAVENAALIPWFFMSAYIHSVIVQEQRGMLRRWNVVLVGLTFVLTILGTYMTRSGLIDSVHTFAESEVGNYFLALLIAVTVFTFGMVVRRWFDLSPKAQIDSAMSREAAFLANNWLFTAMGFVVLWGTLFPKLREMATGVAISIGPPWFNSFMRPMGLVLLLLMGIGTLLPWRRLTIRYLRRNFVVPTVMMLGVSAGLIALYWQTRGQFLGANVRTIYAVEAIICVALVVFNLAILIIEFGRGTTARMRATGSDPFTAFFSLFARHRRRYGGYVVHIGIIFVFLAFVGNAIKVDRDITMTVGETVQLADYEVTFENFTEERLGDRVDFVAEMSLTRNGREVGRLFPARSDYTNYATSLDGMPDPMKVTSEIYIRSNPIEDVYIAMLNFGDGGQSAAFKLEVFPFTWWFWFGGLVMLIGTLVCLWPEDAFGDRTYRAGPTARRSAAVATLFSVVLVSVVVFGAAGVATAQESPAAELTSEQERVAYEVFDLVMTTCEGCAGKNLSNASPSCYPSNLDRARIREMAASGSSRDEILAVFVQERGETALAVPSDGGVNRLSWLVPALTMLLGIVLAVGVVRRVTRGGGLTPAVASGAPIGAELEEGGEELLERLRDELAAMD